MNKQLILVVAALAVTLAGTSLAQTTYHVTTNGTDALGANWTTPTSLTNAVALAGANDVVLVSNGTYQVTSQLVIGAAFTVSGFNGREVTTIARDTGAGNFGVFSLSNSNAMLNGLTISNGNATVGGGIWMSAGNVSNCIVTACNATSGGGLYITSGGKGTITDCFIQNCSATSGGGIYMDRADATIRNCDFYDCQASNYGGAAYLWPKATQPKVYSSRFFNNTAGKDGGGIWAISENGGMTTFYNCLVYNNETTGGSGGGIYGKLNATNCTIAHNACALSGAGGGILKNAGTIVNTILYYNTRSALVDNYGASESGITYSCSPGLTGIGDIIEPPGFVDHDNDDYRIAWDSPCVDRGTSVLGLTNDISGTVRPVDGDDDGQAKYDIGAYEYVGRSNMPFAVSFQTDMRTGLDSLLVTFTPQLTGTNRTTTWYGWDFDGDGSYDVTGTGQATAVERTFTPGHYTIAFAATNGLNEGDVEVKTNWVNVVASTMYVSSGGSNAFPYDTWDSAATKIHTALDVAIDGCQIVLAAETHVITNNIYIDRALSILGNGGPESVVVTKPDGAPYFRLFTLFNANAVIGNLTISNGVSAGGIYLRNGLVTNCAVVSCSGTSGAGIYLESGYVRNSRIEDCVALANGGGLYIAEGGSGTLTDSIIQNCSATSGGGIYMDRADATIRNCDFYDCQASNYGGAAYLWPKATQPKVYSSRFFNNTASKDGGGIWATSENGGMTTFYNCLVYNNETTGGSGGGIYGKLNATNCTIAHNACALSGAGGGILKNAGTIVNTILYYNTRGAPVDNYGANESGITYSCSPGLTGTGDIIEPPGFVDHDNDDYRIAWDSPCVDRGTSVLGLTNDISGTVRPVDGDDDGQADYDIGAYEYVGGSNMPFAVSFQTDERTGLDSLLVTFTPQLTGTDPTTTWYGWDFDGDGSYDETGTGQATSASKTFTPGQYTIAFAATNGLNEGDVEVKTNWINVVASTMYVSSGGSNAFPYDTWDSAATNFHTVLDVAVDGCQIVLAAETHIITNNIYIDRALSILGSGGPESVVVTKPDGAPYFRLFTLFNANAVIGNLTVSNGVSAGGIYLRNGLVTNCAVVSCSGTSGAGIYLENGYVRNSLIKDCIALAYGGGLYIAEGGSGTITDCIIQNCSATSGGGVACYKAAMLMQDSMINRCTASGIGGGGGVFVHGKATSPTLKRCRIFDNTSAGEGGGAVIETENQAQAMIDNCLVFGNISTGNRGGGLSINAHYGVKITSCTIASNRCASASTGGGVYNLEGASVTNCIVYYNQSGAAANDYAGNIALVSYSCAPELTNGTQGNINAVPRFRDIANDDYGLSASSPCVDTGITLTGMDTDIDLGRGKRLVGVSVDMGAYESSGQSGSIFLLR